MGEPANTVDSHCAGASRQLPQDLASSIDLSSAEEKRVHVSVICISRKHRAAPASSSCPTAWPRQIRFAGYDRYLVLMPHQ